MSNIIRSYLGAMARDVVVKRAVKGIVLIYIDEMGINSFALKVIVDFIRPHFIGLCGVAVGTTSLKSQD
jgi:hypothetical protein